MVYPIRYLSACSVSIQNKSPVDGLRVSIKAAHYRRGLTAVDFTTVGSNWRHSLCPQGS
ncbi:unnamed protein product [Discula destructiva]